MIIQLWKNTVELHRRILYQSSKDCMLSISKQQGKLYIFNWALSVIVISMLELLLLNIKYQTFSGGFLQDNQISGFQQISFFLLLLFAINMFFYGFITYSTYIIARKFQISELKTNYHLLWLMLFGSILLISMKYQLYTYFGDFLTFSIVKNLGGGSVLDAVIYVIQEGFIAIAALFFCAVLWLIGAHIIRKYCVPASQSTSVIIPFFAWTGCIIGMIVIVSISNQDRNIRYHLKRTTAYITASFAVNQINVSNDNIYPLDIPDNGIDEDGLNGNFHFSPSKKTDYIYAKLKRHIVLVVLESVRQDVLDQKVNKRVVTPMLRKIASTGTRINTYYSHTGYTSSSLAAIFTMNPGITGDPPRLLEILKANQYTVSVISGQDESFGEISSNTGTKKYSDFYFDASMAPEKRMFSSASPGSLAVPDKEVIFQFKTHAAQTDWKKPQFFYLNFQSAHFPYFHEGMPKLITNNPLSRKDLTPGNREKLRETYLNSVAVADQSLGQVVDELVRLKILDDTLLVIVGDHGESLFDDGVLGHGMRISKNQLNTVFVSNQLLKEKGVFGHSDLGRLLLENSGSVNKSMPTPENKEVFHFIGPIDAPTYIGLTLKNDSRFIIDLTERIYQIEEKDGRITSYSEAQVKLNNDMNEKFNHLIEIWETQRWQLHLNTINATKLNSGELK